MSGNRLVIALVVLVGLGGLTLWKVQQRKTEDTRGPSVGVTLPKVDKDAVDEISISSTEHGTVRLKKQDGVWRLTVPLEAEASQSAAETALDKLVELEVTGVAATKDTNHARLEVDQEKGVHVVANQAGSPIIDIIIGKYQTGNTMVRKQGEVPVATVKGSLRYAFDKELKDWRDREITKLKADEITSVSFTNSKGSFSFVKDGDWKPVEGQAPIENFDPGKVKSAVTTLANLRASDFAAPDATQEQTGLGEGAAVVTFTQLTPPPPKPEGEAQGEGEGESTPTAAATETRYEVRIGNKDDKNYYLALAGKDVSFMVSTFVGERLTPGPDGFQKDPEPAGDAAKPQIPEGVKLPKDFKLPPGAEIRTRESVLAEQKKAEGE